METVQKSSQATYQITVILTRTFVYTSIGRQGDYFPFEIELTQHKWITTLMGMWSASICISVVINKSLTDVSLSLFPLILGYP